MINKNICKFVTGINEEQFITTNFVLENNSPKYIKMQNRENYSINLVVGGKGFLHTELTKKELKPGTIFFTFSDLKFAIENTDDLSYIYVTFKGNRSKDFFEKFDISKNECVFEGYGGLISFWQNCIGKANEKNIDLISESVVLYTFSQMTPVSYDKEKSLIRDVIKYVEDNFNDYELSLFSLSEKFGYNSKYISRIFKKSVGITFSEYLKNSRINHAIFLIEQGITSVKNVSFLCGYSDPFYFSNVFKKSTGYSPSEYIEKN